MKFILSKTIALLPYRRFQLAVRIIWSYIVHHIVSCSSGDFVHFRKRVWVRFSTSFYPCYYFISDQIFLSEEILDVNWYSMERWNETKASTEPRKLEEVWAFKNSSTWLGYNKDSFQLFVETWKKWRVKFLIQTL